MTTARLQSLIWMFIFGGMLLIGLGLSVRRGDADLGLGIALFGAVATVAGIVLIYVRSRMRESV